MILVSLVLASCSKTEQSTANGKTPDSEKETINYGDYKGSIYSINGAPSYRQAEVSFEGKIEDRKLTLNKNDYYTIKSVKEINYPIDFEMLNQLIG